MHISEVAATIESDTSWAGRSELYAFLKWHMLRVAEVLILSSNILRVCAKREKQVAYYVVLYKRMYKVHKPEHCLSYFSIIYINSYRECILCLWCVGTYIPSVGINITYFGGTLFGFAYGVVRQRFIIFQKGGNYTSPTLYVFCVKK